MSLWSYLGDAVKAINPINIVSDIGSSLLGYNMNSHSQNKQNDYNLQLYKMQRSDALSDRAHLEQYNSPKNQMRLLKEAGLNPMLAYSQLGNFQSVLPNKTSAEGGASYAPYRLDFANALPLAQVENINADTKLKESQAALNSKKADTETEKKYQIYKQVRMLDYRLKFEDERSIFYSELARAEWILNGNRASTAGYINDTWKERAAHALEIVEADLQFIRSKTNLNVAQVTTEVVRRALMRSQAAFYDVNKELTESKKELVDKDVEIAAEELSGAILQNGITALTFEKLQSIMPALTAGAYISLIGDLISGYKDYRSGRAAKPRY